MALALALAGACDARPAEDAAAVALDAPHVLGSTESIATIEDLTVLPNGVVWVLNSVDPRFVAFDSTGTVVAAQGSSGGGPEEVRAPAGFVTHDASDSAWVLDFLRHSLIDPAAPEWREVALPTDDLPRGSLRGGMSLLSPIVRTASLGDEVILPRTTGSLESGLARFRMAILGADLVAFDPATGSVRTIVSLRDVLDDPAAGFEPTEGGAPLWYRLWAVCGDDEIRVYDRTRNALRGFTRTGEELEPIALPPVRLTEVSARDFARAVFPLRQAEITGGVGDRMSAEDSARTLNAMVGGVKGQPHQLATYLPRYVDLRCSPEGVVWLQPLDVAAGGLRGGRLWYRIAPDGATREVILPPRFDALRFTADRVWGVLRDDFDVASVAWLELPALRHPFSHDR